MLAKVNKKGEKLWKMMQLHQYFTKKFDNFPNIPAIVGADFDIEPNDICVRNIIKSVFVDFQTLQDQINQAQMNMGTIQELGDEEYRFKNIPTNIGSIIINNPYIFIDQGLKYPLSTKQKYNKESEVLIIINLDCMLLDISFFNNNFENIQNLAFN